MARMSREFPLVLLGAGVLTAGYFLYPEPDLEAKEAAHMEKEAGIVAENGVPNGNGNGNGNNTAGRHSSFIWIHSYGYGGYGGGGTRSALSSAGGSVARGGFGTMGHASAGT